MKLFFTLVFHLTLLLGLRTWTFAGETTNPVARDPVMLASCDVCDVDCLYDPKGYRYSLPRPVLEGFLSGVAFDHKTPYSEEERSRLEADTREIFQSIRSNDPVKEKLAVMTAGAPGAGKTMLLREDLERHLLQGKRYAYVDPDDVCLRQQSRTYQRELGQGDGSVTSRLEAYNKWRPGSNAAAHLILGHLIRDGFGFYFGTTSTGPASCKFWEFLKAQGYQIKVLYVAAPDEVRWDSIRERDKTFVQSTEQDVREKGLLLPQRMMDTFLAFADEIEIHYRDEVKKSAVLSARWLRDSDSKDSLGTLTILSARDYEKVKVIHNAAVAGLKRPELSWEKTIEKHSTVVR